MANNRTYNNRNQLWTRVVLDSADPCGVTVTLDYDRNGNLTSDGEKFTYVFNPFGQLVAIKDHFKGSLLAEFTYSGLGHRISERTDTSDAVDSGKPDGLVDGSDRVFYIATDPQGRRVATFRKNDEHPKETFVWTPAGVSGPGGNVGGALILRDRVADASSPEYWAVTTAEEPRPERHFYCSDSGLSVVALIGLGDDKDGPTGVLAEQYRYSATGVPYGIPLGDVNSNGEVEIVSGLIVDKQAVDAIAGAGEAGYQVRADLDLDGLVDSADIAIADAAAGAVLGRGKLSMGAVSSRVGLGGLERVGIAGGAWTVRVGLYRDDLNQQVVSEVVGSSRLSSRGTAVPGCVNVHCPIGSCNNRACEATLTAFRDAPPPADEPKPDTRADCRAAVQARISVNLRGCRLVQRGDGRFDIVCERQNPEQQKCLNAARDAADNCCNEGVSVGSCYREAVVAQATCLATPPPPPPTNPAPPVPIDSANRDTWWFLTPRDLGTVTNCKLEGPWTAETCQGLCSCAARDNVLMLKGCMACCLLGGQAAVRCVAAALSLPWDKVRPFLPPGWPQGVPGSEGNP